jgi:hypothetical protein
MPDINKAYTWAIQTCNAPNIGYSQTYRNQQTIGGVTYYDCSSFINYALLAGGFETPSYAPNSNAFTTYSEPDELLRLGFTEVDPNGEILPGDIGVSSYHTEMCYEKGTGSAIFMGAHTDLAPLADQVSIGNYTQSFPRIFRYGSGGATGYGASIYVVSALCGNAWRESHINPAQEELSGGGGFGIFQWTAGRRTALEQWLSENGYDRTSPDGQVKYLFVEADWLGEFAGITSLDEFINSDSRDIPALTEAFMKCWERPAESDPSLRIEYANKCFDFIQEHAQDSSINSWVIKNELLGEPDILNNAVMMYRLLSAGGGSGGTAGSKKSKMPVWMMIRYKLF